ncbi:MAG: anti-sigma E factor RseA [Mycobacterium sp.]
MADPGDVFRRAFSWLPAQFASQSNEPVGPRQFGSTEHLSTEAIAAFVDGELRMTAHLRAGHHLSLCPSCAAEVDAQRQARTALRDACPIAMPNSLLGLLSQIPERNPEIPAIEEPPQQVTEGAGRARRKRR